MNDALFFPSYLTSRKCWVLWRLETKKERQTKIPYCVRNPSKRASSTDPATWACFEEAMQVLHSSGERFNGVGVALSRSLGVCVFDLDHCINNGTVNEETAQVIHLFGGRTYIEYSQSGTGLHVFTLGALQRSFKTGIEGYSEGRYIAMTGKPFVRAEITENQAAVDYLLEKYGKQKRNAPVAVYRPSEPLNLSDREIIRHAMKNAKFAAIYSKTEAWKEWFPSQSEADLWLCGMLAYWCEREPAAIDRIFRTSALMRTKWDQKHGEQTYAELTIMKAIAGCTCTFQEWKRNREEVKEHDMREHLRKQSDAIRRNWMCNR